MAQHPRLGAYVGRDGVGDGPAGCKLAGWNDKQDAKAKATYWPERWRDGLCRCPACLVGRFDPNQTIRNVGLG